MGGAHATTVRGCHFYDLSGSAVQIGRNDMWAPDTPLAMRELNNSVLDSLIEYAANEFHGAVGVQVGGSAPFACLDRAETSRMRRPNPTRSPNVSPNACSHANTRE